MPLTAENCPALVSTGPGGPTKEQHMLSKKVRAEVTKQTSINGQAARVGSVVDVEESEFKRMSATGRLKAAEAGAKLHMVTKEEAQAAAKANANGAVQTRDPRASVTRDQ
jgi:hypothetical protein